VEKPGFETFEERWYTVPRPGRPYESRTLTEVREMIAELAQSTNKVVFQSMDFFIDWATLQVTRAAGQAIDQISFAALTRQMALGEAAFCFRGSTTPSVNALFGSAGNESTAVGAGYLWGTAPGASQVVKDMVNLLLDDGYNPPFDLVVSSNLAGYLNNFINANPVTPTRERHSIAGLLGQPETYFPYIFDMLPASGEDVNRVYPLPTRTAQSGVAMVLVPDPGNYQLIVEQPFTQIYGGFDITRKGYAATMFQAFTFRVWDANAICKHTQVQIS
jgi:hypothetical protein